jgi:hypothetical protein
MSKTNT